MKKQLFLLSSLCLIFAACDNYNTTPNADNTANNARDRSGQTLTPGDQAENEADRTITQRVRQALLDDDSFSTNAKNIKIITSNGIITLRGTVNSEREKAEIGRKARAISGVRNVDNQLEIIAIRTDGGPNFEGRNFNR